jgi:predicted Rossmann fold nucleotide-binding protein DprA/Smf involved in DNA uptake
LIEEFQMITENTKAILLLTSFFNSSEVGKYKILTINEYGYFACWLRHNDYKPVELLDESVLEDIWVKWDTPSSHIKAKKIIDFARLDNTIANITYERIKGLIARGASLSMALDRWQSAGVWIMDRKHEHYPPTILKHLKHQSPAVLFGVGNSELLANGAIGFVGSRDCTSQDEQATTDYVEVINSLQYQVVSGAAKGVDTHSMLASLNNGNTAIGVLTDSLFKASASGQWRQALKEKRLVLISPFFPEGRFTPANAMARNKYIYLLSQATVVVTSGETGGTWKGAVENLKKNWVPMLVSSHVQPLQAGNQALLQGFPKTNAKAYELSLQNAAEQIKHAIFDTPKSEGSSVINQPPTENVKDEVSTYLQPPKRPHVTKDMFEDAATNPSEESHVVETTGKTPEAETPTTNGIETATETEQLAKEPDTKLAAQEKFEMDLQKISNDPIHSAQDDTSNPAMPLLDVFYSKVCELIDQQAQGLIDKQTLDEHFPEFEIISKTALNKWLNHLLEKNKLLQPDARKKEYMLPKNADFTE